MKLLFATLLFAMPAYAQTIPLYVVSVDGPNALSYQQVNSLLANMRQYFLQETGINFVVKRHVRDRQRFPLCNQLANRLLCYSRWSGRLARRSRNKRTLRLAILPPAQDQGIWWMWGYAQTGCSYGRRLASAVIGAMPRNHLGQPREAHSMVYAAHELMHLASGTHQDARPNLMHSDALKYFAGYLPVEDQTRREVSACIR